MTEEKRSLTISSFCLIGSASAAAAASGIADILSATLFGAVFTASFFPDTARLRRLLPARFFPFVVIVYLCVATADYFLLSPDWQRILLHMIWFASAVKLITRSGDQDWPPLYFLGSVQLLLAAAQPTGTVFWICFAVFIVSGISALMLFELRRISCKDSIATAQTGFPIRAFFIAVTGIAVAVTVAAIPLFFFFPRLQTGNNLPWTSETDSFLVDFIEEIEAIEPGRAGPPQQPETVVMRVKTDAPLENLPYNLKWRGASFDYYDGRAWLLYRREQMSIATQGRFYKLEDSAMGSELLQQTFFMEENLTNRVFAAHRTLAVSTDIGFLRRDTSDNLYAQKPAKSKIDYTVVSETIHPDAGKISDWTPIPDDIRLTWLQLPELDPRVVQLAHDITRRYRRQYDKARALETWLSLNYGYSMTLSPIYEVHENGDPLAIFLFDAREGYCGHFATAMTVMLRAIGIPARITSGFLAGEYNPIGGSWTVRRKHSHIWTEAWFSPYGWVEFDATPEEEFMAEPLRGRFFANLADAAGLWWRENVAGYDASRQYSIISGFFTRVNKAEDRAGEFFSSSANRAYAVFHLLPQIATSAKITSVSILFIAVLVIIIFRRIRRRIPGVFLRNKQNPQTAAIDFYAEALIFLKARGFVPEKAQTPMEFARNFGSHPAADALFDLTRFYNEVRFGGPTVQFRRDEARALLRSLKAAFN